jgi:hypothetical protein
MQAHVFTAMMQPGMRCVAVSVQQQQQQQAEEHTQREWMVHVCVIIELSEHALAAHMHGSAAD